MKISVLGCGYVGLVSGACFADFGDTVVCADLDETKIEALNRGEIPIFEPGLEQIVESNVQSGRLSFTTQVEQAIADADVIFIAVGTPARRGDGHADLSYVYAVARTISTSLDGYTVIVTKSTVPVGTGDEVERIIREGNSQADFSVVSNPEFLREGAAIEDFKRPDRIIVGTDDPRARDVMNEVYRPLFLNHSPILFVSRRTAELTKYASNGFLAMKITFINELADLCDAVGANVQDVARGIGLDNRIGPKFLNAGPGFGGSCFPKDTIALVKTAQDHDSPVRLVETTVDINNRRKPAMAEKIIAACGGNVRDRVIAILGLTFKPNTDDMREAPSIAIIRSLQNGGAKIRAFDPQGMKSAAEMLDDIHYAEDAYDAAVGADAIVIVTEWEAFRALDLERIKELLKSPVMIDLRNIYRPAEMKQLGFDYWSIGRTESEPG
ncbi:MAG: UDP-glucose/GDP-mannose dehydrogenase family protein [Alphaproteobacteria bacterium]|nr:UDP-glucose/GDP-mannose dehydrogenase family protein [Alphaproteobacteria bacterium]